MDKCLVIAVEHTESGRRTDGHSGEALVKRRPHPERASSRALLRAPRELRRRGSYSGRLIQTALTRKCQASDEKPSSCHAAMPPVGSVHSRGPRRSHCYGCRSPIRGLPTRAVDRPDTLSRLPPAAKQPGRLPAHAGRVSGCHNLSLQLPRRDLQPSGESVSPALDTTVPPTSRGAMTLRAYDFLCGHFLPCPPGPNWGVDRSMAGSAVPTSAERTSVPRLVTDAFDVRDPTVVALLWELGAGIRTSADHLAAAVGLSNRFALSRLLSRYRLPSLTDLRGCLRVLQWLRTWETDRVPLSHQALKNGEDPAAWYRTVKRVTGQDWSELKGSSTTLVAAALRERFVRGSET